VTSQTDIAALGADHLWDFDGDAVDGLGGTSGTNNGCIFTDAAIALDASNCMTTNGLTDRIVIASTTNINNSAQARKAVCGWFSPTSYDQPPSRIYGEGTQATVYQFIMGYGNQLTFECVEPTNFATGLQVYGPSLTPGRAYHMCGIFLGSSWGNEVKLFVDGVEQTLASPVNRQPGTASLDARTAAQFGDPSATVGVGGNIVLQQASRNGKYQHWATWGDEADADLTDTEIRTILFEKQALSDNTVETATISTMQADLNTIGTSQSTPGLMPNAALNIEVLPISGGGDFTLTTSLLFDPLSSCHFRYNGTLDNLTLVNIGSGNASIVSAPFGGTVIIATRQTLTITVLDATTLAPVVGARVFIIADTGGDLAVGTVIANAITNSSGVATATHDFTNDQPIIGKVRKGSSTLFYSQGAIPGPLTSTALVSTILLVPDE